MNIYPDWFIEKYGKFYTSEYAKKELNYIHEITFEEWLERKWNKRELEIKQARERADQKQFYSLGV